MFSRFEKPTIEELKKILGYLPASDRETWFKTFAIVGRTYAQDASAYSACQEWARSYSGRKPEDERKERTEFYDSSRRSGPGIGALIKQAKSYGYKPPVSKNAGVHVHGAPVSAIVGLEVVTPIQGLEPPKNPLQNDLYGSAQILSQSSLKFWLWVESVPAGKRAAFLRRYSKAFRTLPTVEGSYFILLNEFCNSRELYSFDAFTEWVEDHYSDFDRDELVLLLSKADMSANYEAAEESLDRAVKASWMINLQNEVAELSNQLTNQQLSPAQSEQALAHFVEATKPYNPKLPALTGHDIAPIGRRIVTENLDPALRAMYYTPSGYDVFDRHIYGWRRGGVTLFAAHSGMGKTWFGIDAANNVIKNGGNVLFISTEMDRESIAERFFLNTGTASMNTLMESEYQEELINSITKETDERFELDESINVIEAYKLSEVLNAIEDRNDFKPLDLVVVDYIQDIENDMCSKNDQQYQKVKGIMEQLRRTSKKCGCPVLALAQLNNPNRKAGANQKPNMHDMAASSAIVHDAMAVIIMYKLEDTSGSINETRCEIVKTRYGQIPSAHFKITRTAGSHFEFIQ